MELGNLTESNCEDLYFWEKGREGQKLLWGDPDWQRCWSSNWPVWWWRSVPALRGRVWSPRWVTRSRSLHHWSPHPCCLPGKIGNPRGGLPLRAPRLRPLITHTLTSLCHCPPVCPFTGSVFSKFRFALKFLLLHHMENPNCVCFTAHLIYKIIKKILIFFKFKKIKGFKNSTKKQRRKLFPKSTTIKH